MKYTIIFALFSFFTLTACVDDELQTCIDSNDELTEGYKDGYAINLTVTIDKMGGRRAQTTEELEELESYIDPEKFRVLFFDHNDKFLFESKSRWIKQLLSTNDMAQWLVSVPMYTYGNDEKYNWNWDSIRTALTTDSFKVAVLANRPLLEWSPKFEDTAQDPTWFDNTGPHWGAEDTQWYVNEYNKNKSEGEKIKAKDVFDIHHSQYDPIYTGKSWSSDNTKENNNIGFYEFVMEKGNSAENYDSLYMSSTSSWVDWGPNGNNLDPIWNNRKWFIHPTTTHPIPMYGIQRFKPIDEKMWTKGTPFNISRITKNQPDNYAYRSIALLRSVVKLELLFPKLTNQEIVFVAMFYPNIYARCEPMDVWTPTDLIWVEEKDDLNHEKCEWNNIVKYGPVARDADRNNQKTALWEYQQRMSWFYGAWKDKDWPFPELDASVKFGGDAPIGLNDSLHYPRIFNTCIQRNNLVYCGENLQIDKSNARYYHYVVYTGERNINDPTKLDYICNTGSGNPTICYWAIYIRNTRTNTYTYYAVPITSYDGYSTMTTNGPAFKKDTNDFIPDGTKNKEPGNGAVSINNYEKEVMKTNSTLPKPWPLLRNHVYRITLGDTENTARNRGAGNEGFYVKSERLRSESLTIE